MDVVVVGSNNDTRFAVVDFTNPNRPTHVLANAGVSGGCMVDCSGTLAAVGDFNGSRVVLCDISNPASPVLKGRINTRLSGIGAISIDGTLVLVGELNGLRAVLIDATNPANPIIVSTHRTGISSIGSIAISGKAAVAAGPNDQAFALIDYTDPLNPSHTTFNSGMSRVFFAGPLNVDMEGGHASVGDNGSGNLFFFDVSGATAVHLGTKATMQNGVFSVSISGSIVAAASSNNVAISLVSFQSPDRPTETTISNTGLNGGATVKLSGNRLAAGDILGTQVALFSLSGTNATLLARKIHEVGGVV